MHPLAESVRQAEAAYQRVCDAVPRAEAALRQAALAAIAGDFQRLFDRYVETAKAAIAAEREIGALIAFLRTRGWGDWACVELARRVADARIIRPVRTRFEDEEIAAAAPYIALHAARLEKLLAGEESL
jgi:hypothetical protein